MYLGLVLPYAKGLGPMIVNTINGLKYIAPNKRWPMPRIAFRGRQFTFEKIHEFAWPLNPSNAVDGKWNVAYLKPIGGGQEIGPRAMHRVRQWSAGNSKYIVGPYSIKEAYELYPSFAQRLFRPGRFDINGNWLGPVVGSQLIVPNVWMGDPAPEKLAQIDYRPTQTECDNDGDINLDAIFGGE
jgi:hypothetical protein